MSRIITIQPYKHYDQWVFDDPSRGLDKEAFVDGADSLIEVVTVRFGIDHPEVGFQMSFSDESIPEAQVVLTKVGPKDDGTIYEWEGHRAWLCPSLKLYFTACRRFSVERPALGFTMLISDEAFPDVNVVLTKVGPDGSGTVYEWEGMKGWLCANLRLYFDPPPEKLFIALRGIMHSRWTRFLGWLSGM